MASVPASIFMARWTSSEAVSRSTLPISLRYMRTGSPVSMTVEVSCLRARARLERLGLAVLALGTERRASLTAFASAALSDSPSSSSNSSLETSSSSKSSSESSPEENSWLEDSLLVISTPFARSASYRSESSSESTSMSLMASWMSSSETLADALAPPASSSRTRVSSSESLLSDFFLLPATYLPFDA